MPTTIIGGAADVDDGDGNDGGGDEGATDNEDMGATDDDGIGGDVNRVVPQHQGHSLPPSAAIRQKQNRFPVSRTNFPVR